MFDISKVILIVNKVNLHGGSTSFSKFKQMSHLHYVTISTPQAHTNKVAYISLWIRKITWKTIANLPLGRWFLCPN